MITGKTALTRKQAGHRQTVTGRFVAVRWHASLRLWAYLVARFHAAGHAGCCGEEQGQENDSSDPWAEVRLSSCLEVRMVQQQAAAGVCTS